MFEMFKRYEFTAEEWYQIKQKCDSEDILFLSTPQNRSDLDLLLNLEEVYLNDESIIKNFKGQLTIKDNKIFFANIFGDFNKTDNLKYIKYK